MANKMLKTTEELMALSEEELTDVLLESPYNNSAMLREQLRRVLKDTRDYKQAFEREYEVRENLEEKQEKMKNALKDFY